MSVSLPDCQQQQPLPSISDFEIVKYVSSGAYGDVYLAKRLSQDPDDTQLFAIKRVAKKTLVTKNLMDQIRCERVALAMSRCRHVVHLYYSLQTDSHVYLVMEYLCGGDLRSMLMAVGCLAQSAAVVYAAEVALALEYLHGHGIIHRDIKPDNMLVSASGHIKLTDFGLSQVSLDRLAQHQQQLLLHGGAGGTPGGYQPSAEKRYPRTPRQLMSLAADFSFGSAGGCGGTRPTPAPPPTPPPPPCFDDSASPLGLPAAPLDTEVEEPLENDEEEVEERRRVRFNSARNAEASAEIPVEAEEEEEVGDAVDDGEATPSSGGDSGSRRRITFASRQRHGGHSQRQQPWQRLLGTPDYLAPELILGQPHGTPVDYWALGACLFEFLTGCPPFAAGSPDEVMDNILGRAIPWPDPEEGEGDREEEEALSAEAVSAIDGLLNWEPDCRLTIGDLRRHPLFSGVPWAGLHSAEAPFVPDLRGDAQDTTYFEPRNRARGDSGSPVKSPPA